MHRNQFSVNIYILFWSNCLLYIICNADIWQILKWYNFVSSLLIFTTTEQNYWFCSFLSYIRWKAFCKRCSKILYNNCCFFFPFLNHIKPYSCFNLTTFASETNVFSRSVFDLIISICSLLLILILLVVIYNFLKKSNFQLIRFVTNLY